MTGCNCYVIFMVFGAVFAYLKWKFAMAKFYRSSLEANVERAQSSRESLEKCGNIYLNRTSCLYQTNDTIHAPPFATPLL